MGTSRICGTWQHMGQGLGVGKLLGCTWLTVTSSSSIFADQRHWLAGESSTGAPVTTTSSQVSEEPCVTGC